MRRFIRRPSPSMVVAIIAVMAASTGSATAAKLMSGKDVRHGSLTGVDIKDGSIALKDLSRSARKARAAAGAGVNGVNGLHGPKGDTGATGAQGERGAAGSDASVTVRKFNNTDERILITGKFQDQNDAVATTGAEVPDDQLATNIGDVQLPAGKWLVFAKVRTDKVRRSTDLTAQGNPTEQAPHVLPEEDAEPLQLAGLSEQVTCRLVTPEDQDDSGRALVGFNEQVTLDMFRTITVPQDQTLEVNCWQPKRDGNGDGIVATGLRINAVKIGSDADLIANSGTGQG